MIIEQFIQWHTKIAPEIRDVLSLLSVKLDKEPEGLINDLMVIETWNGRLQELLAESNGYLDRARGELIQSREAGTELSRKIALDSDTSAIRVVRDTLEGLCDAIKQRIILGESVLSFSKQFPERKAAEILGRPF